MTEDRNGDYAHGGVHYLNLIDDSRRTQVKITKDTLKRLDTMFQQTADELAKQAVAAKTNSITERWKLDYEKEVRAVLANMRNEQYNISVDGMRRAATNGIYTQQEIFSNMFKKVDDKVMKSFTSVLSRVPEKALNELLSGTMYKDGAGLSKRIWKDTKKMENDISYIIEQAILQKKSAINLAKDLEQYVKDDSRTSYDWGNVYPELSSKQCSYEAQRLARTSITHAYQLATIRSSQDNPYIEGIRWLSANSHRTCDLCLERSMQNDYDLGEGVFPKDKVPLDHPNGLCTLAPFIPKSLEEIGNELKSWIDGNGDPTLNNAFNKWLDKKGIDISNRHDTMDSSQMLNQNFKKLLANANGLGANYKQTLEEVFTDGTDVAKEVFIKNVPLNSVDDFNYNATSHYRPSTNKIKIDSTSDMKHDKIKGLTFFHEHGHLLDDINGRSYLSTATNDFKRALEDDYNSYLSMVMKSNKVGKKEAYKLISSELAGFENVGVSDVYGGLSSNKAVGWFMHPTPYWKRDPDLIQLEAFANMYSAHFSNEQYIQMEKFFPKAFNTFNKMLEGLK